MALHINDLAYLRVGWQKVVDHGQYGNTIYVFQYDGNKLMAVTNKNQGVGTLIETISAKPAPAVDAPHRADGFSRSEPADYSVLYEGTGKL